MITSYRLHDVFWLIFEDSRSVLQKNLMNLVHAHDVVGRIVCELVDIVKVLFLFHLLNFCGSICQVFLIGDMRFSLPGWTFNVFKIGVRRLSHILLAEGFKSWSILYFVSLPGGIYLLIIGLRHRNRGI